MNSEAGQYKKLHRATVERFFLVKKKQEECNRLNANMTDLQQFVHNMLYVTNDKVKILEQGRAIAKCIYLFV